MEQLFLAVVLMLSGEPSGSAEPSMFGMVAVGVFCTVFIAATLALLWRALDEVEES